MTDYNPQLTTPGMVLPEEADEYEVELAIDIRQHLLDGNLDKADSIYQELRSYQWLYKPVEDFDILEYDDYDDDEDDLWN